MWIAKSYLSCHCLLLIVVLVIFLSCIKNSTPRDAFAALGRVGADIWSSGGLSKALNKKGNSMNVKAFLGTFLLAGLCTAGAPAMAINLACSGVSVHTASRNDVTLDGDIADGCDISTVNPAQHRDGNTTGFTDNFGSGWSLLSKVTGKTVPSATTTATFGGVDYTINFTETPGSGTKQGTWTINVNKAVTVDLVFAIHASNHSGAFFFDNQELTSSPLGNAGTWAINWYSNGNQVPGFSNLTIFARDQHVSAVPEPETYAMLLAGLGLVGFMARRRKQQ